MDSVLSAYRKRLIALQVYMTSKMLYRKLNLGQPFGMPYR